MAPRRARRRLGATAVQVGAGAVYAAAAFTSALAPALERELGVADGAALATVPFCAAFALAFLPWGRAADRFGALPCLVAALAGTALGGVVFALASDPATAVAARVVQGAAAAAYPPAAQAVLSAGAGSARSGRAVGGMLIAVALGTLGAPLAAALVEGVGGWRSAAVVFGVVLPACAALVLASRTHIQARPAKVAGRERQKLGSLPLAAGYAVAALVLGAQWTLLTRIDDLLGADGLGLGAGAPQLVAAVSGIAGIALVALCARASDRSGPRRPMVAVLAAGALAAAAAAAAPERGAEAVTVVGLGAFLALYWGYLPVVSVQVIRSAPESLRATAIAALYSSMWLGAALAGLAAVAAPGWRTLLAGAAVLWLVACVVAAAGFHRDPVRA